MVFGLAGAVYGDFDEYTPSDEAEDEEEAAMEAKAAEKPPHNAPPVDFYNSQRQIAILEGCVFSVKPGLVLLSGALRWFLHSWSTVSDADD